MNFGPEIIRMWVEDLSVPSHQAYWREVSQNNWYKGRVQELDPGLVIPFDPYKWHGFEGQGDITAISYQAEIVYFADRSDLEWLGFEFDKPQASRSEQDGPEVVRVNGEEDICLLRHVKLKDRDAFTEALEVLDEEQAQLLTDLEERAERLRLLLEEEEILAEECRRASLLVDDHTSHIREMIIDMLEDVSATATSVEVKQVVACLRSAVINDEIDFEDYLEKLEGDLQVVHTVPLEQVRKAIEKWAGAISKELTQLF